MNNTNSTEELLKTIDLTLDDVMKIIEEGVRGRYRAFGHLREITTADDLKQEVFLYYLSKMKSTGDIRLNYYIKKYGNREHIINLIKQTSYQIPLWVLKSRVAKENEVTMSLYINVGKYDALEKKTLIDTLPDNRSELDIYENITSKELYELLKEELNELNLKRLKQEYKKDNQENAYDEYNLPFVLDTANYVKAYERTLIQLQIVKDLSDGYQKNVLTNKYNNFKEDIEIIKKALFGRLYTYLRTF